MRHCRLRYEYITEKIRPEGPRHLLLSDVLNVFLLMLLGGIVDEHVKAAELLHSAVDRIFAEIGGPDIAVEKKASASFC
jgi:hypothetical protein